MQSLKEFFCGGDNETWTPSKYVLANLALRACLHLEADIEHLCALAVHPETREAITSS